MGFNARCQTGIRYRHKLPEQLRAPAPTRDAIPLELSAPGLILTTGSRFKIASHILVARYLLD